MKSLPTPVEAPRQSSCTLPARSARLAKTNRSIRRVMLSSLLVLIGFSVAQQANAVVPEPPSIHAIEPASALPGQDIVIHGVHFDGLPEQIAVYVGAVQAEVTFSSPTRLEARLPQFLSSGRISATFPGKTSTLSPQTFQAGLEEPGTVTSKSFAGPAGHPHMPLTDQIFFSLDTRDDSALSGSSQGVNLADLNRNGRPDIVVANFHRDVLIFFENIHEEGDLAESSFSRVASHPTGIGPVNSAVGDLNGNGWLDVVVGSSTDQSVSFFENTTPEAGSSPELTPRGRLPLEFSISAESESHIADFDGDGLMDIIIGGGSVQVLRAESKTEQVDPQNYSVHQVGLSVTTIALSDLNGSGLPDVIGASGNTGITGVRIFQNQSTPGTVAVSPPLLLGTPGHAVTAVAAEDINGNGKPDIIAGTSGNQLFIFENTSVDGVLTFADPVILFPSSSSMHMLKVGATDVSVTAYPIFGLPTGHAECCSRKTSVMAD